MNDTEIKDLKIQALLERVSSLTADYENQVADLRVALTVAYQKAEQSQDGPGQSPEEQNVPVEG